MNTRIAGCCLKYLVVAAVATQMLWSSSPANAVPPNSNPPTIEFWRDSCEADVVMPETPEIHRVIDATVLIVTPGLLVRSADTLSYKIMRDPFTSFDGMIFSKDSHFYGEQRIPLIRNVNPGRSGFLVSPTTVVTTPHATSQLVNFTGYYVLFGYESVPDGLGGCRPPDLDYYPAENVRRVDSDDNFYSPSTGDYSILHLNEPVLDRKFLRVRRNGEAQIGDHATLVGHPAGLAKKIDTNGLVTGIGDDMPLVQYLHSILFNSGSPVYNLTRKYVELAAAFGGVCATYDCTGPGGPSDCSTQALVSECPASASAMNGKGIKAIASEIDPVELLVSPVSLLNPGTSAGTFDHPVTTYSLQAPDGAAYGSAWIDYLIEPPESSASEPFLSIEPSTPLSGTIPAGKTMTFDVAVNVPAAVSGCQTFNREFVVHDLTNEFTDRVSQTLEVGYTAFEVVRRRDGKSIDLEGIQQPYLATEQFTIRNLRPTPVHVRIRGTQDWLKINGNHGTPAALPQSVITLPGNGSAAVTVGLSHEAAYLPLFETYSARIVVESATGTCNLTDPIAIPASFTPGILTVRQAIDAVVPPAARSGPGTALMSTVLVNESFCVSQVKTSYVFDHEVETFPTVSWLAESGWRLRRPGTNAWMPLWNFNDIVPRCRFALDSEEAASTCYLYQAAKTACQFDGLEERPGNCEVLAVGDSPRPSLTHCASGDPACEEFTNVAGQPSLGPWSIAIDDRMDDGIPIQPAIRGWQLQFRGATTFCTQ